MRSFEEIKALAKKGYEESRAIEDAVKANPARANTPQMRRRYRSHGAVMVVLGLGITFANVMSYRSTGGMLVIGIAASVVFVFGGFFMMLTGRNPFLRR